MSMDFRVCLVEDEPIHALIAHRYLLGFSQVVHIDAYVDGKEAFDGLLASVEQGKPLPNLILLDINMPIWDGWQFLDALKPYPQLREIRVYLVSSSQSDYDLNKAKDYDLASRYIYKPLDAEKIAKVLAEMSAAI